MTWRQHLTCKIVVTHESQSYVWEYALPAPQAAPLSELFARNFSKPHHGLSLTHRRLLWTYDKVAMRVWQQAGRALYEWLACLPHADSSQLHIDAYEAGTAVLMALLAEHPPLKKKLHIRSHHAPMRWLQQRFALPTYRRVVWQEISAPEAQRRRAA